MSQKEQAHGLNPTVGAKAHTLSFLCCHTGWRKSKEQGENCLARHQLGLLHIAVFPSAAPQHWQCYSARRVQSKVNQEPVPIDDQKRGSQECPLPSYLWHSARPHPHQLVS